MSDVKPQELKQTKVFFCLEYGHKECLDILLREGADVNHTTMHGRTALCYATSEFNKSHNFCQPYLFCLNLENGQKECLVILLREEADVNHADIDGMTALSLAAGVFR